LSRDVKVVGAAWRAAMRTVVEVGDLVQRTGDGHTGRVLGGREVERSGGVTPTFYKNKNFVQIGVHIKMHIKL
jgi:hypothetical protein